MIQIAHVNIFFRLKKNIESRAEEIAKYIFGDDITKDLHSIKISLIERDKILAVSIHSFCGKNKYFNISVEAFCGDWKSDQRVMKLKQDVWETKERNRLWNEMQERKKVENEKESDLYLLSKLKGKYGLIIQDEYGDDFI